jgi:ATP-binding cassette, subfamily C (CFTR/MRP), member 1
MASNSAPSPAPTTATAPASAPSATPASAPRAPAPAVNPEETANPASRVLLWWLNKLIALGYQRPLEQEDLGPVFSADESRAVSDAFHRHWAEEKGKAKPSVVRALRRTVGGCNILLAVVAFFISAALGFLPPLMLQRLVAYLEGQTPWRPWADVWVDVVGMLVIPIIASVLQAWHYTVMTRAGTQVRTALTAAIFTKAVVLASNGKYATGDIVTRISVDATQGQRLVQFALMLLAAPFQIGVALWLIYNQVGSTLGE